MKKLDAIFPARLKWAHALILTTVFWTVFSNQGAVGRELWPTLRDNQSSSLELQSLSGMKWSLEQTNSFAILHFARRGMTWKVRHEHEPIAIAVPHGDWQATQLMVGEKYYNVIADDPVLELRKHILSVTASSLSHLRIVRCLQTLSIKSGEMRFSWESQSNSLQSLNINKSQVAVLWRNFDRAAATSKAKAKPLDCGAPPEGGLPALFVTRSDLLDETEQTYLDKNIAKLARDVATHLGRWELAKKDIPGEAKKLVKWYKDLGFTVTIEEAAQELIARQPPTIEEQIKLFTPDPVDGKIAIVKTLDEIADFMVETGAFSANERPDTARMIDPRVLQKIMATPELLKIAKGETP